MSVTTTKTRKCIQGTVIALCLTLPSLSQAALITQTASHNDTLPINGEYGQNTGATQQTHSLDAFDPSLGTLNRVVVCLELSQELFASIGELVDDDGAVLLEGTFGSGIRFNNGAGATLEATFFGSEFRDFGETPFDLTFGPHSHEEFAQFNGADVLPFVGSGSIEYDTFMLYDLFFLIAVPDSELETSSRQEPRYFVGQNHADIEVTLKYDYTPTAVVPEPWSIGLLSTGLALISFFGRRAAA